MDECEQSLRLIGGAIFWDYPPLSLLGILMGMGMVPGVTYVVPVVLENFVGYVRRFFDFHDADFDFLSDAELGFPLHSMQGSPKQLVGT